MNEAPPAILKADFVHWYPVQGRKVLKLIFEVPVENTMDVLNKLGAPVVGNWCAIAKLTSGAKDGPVATTSQPDDGDAASPAAAPAKKRWRELSRAQRAGMLCDDDVFRVWISDLMDGPRLTPGGAAAAVRYLCNVSSRSFFDSDPDGCGARWDALETRFMQETGRMAVDR